MEEHEDINKNSGLKSIRISVGELTALHCAQRMSIAWRLGVEPRQLAYEVPSLSFMQGASMPSREQGHKLLMAPQKAVLSRNTGQDIPRLFWTRKVQGSARKRSESPLTHVAFHDMQILYGEKNCPYSALHEWLIDISTNPHHIYTSSIL
jgi:hypothetical protein